MTSSVLIAPMGNKRVRVKTPSGSVILKPGMHTTVHIHQGEVCEFEEFGDGCVPALQPERMANGSSTVHEGGGGPGEPG